MGKYSSIWEKRVDSLITAFVVLTPKVITSKANFNNNSLFITSKGAIKHKFVRRAKKACLINMYMCLWRQYWKRIWSQLGRKEIELVAASLKSCPQKAGDARLMSQIWGRGLKFIAVALRGFLIHGLISLVRFLIIWGWAMSAHFRRNYEP